MRTDELIAALAKNTRPANRAVTRVLILSVLAALLGGFAVIMMGWGMRPDMHTAMRTSAFWMKAGYAAAFAVAGLLLVERLGRPGVAAGWAGWTVLGLAVAAIAVLAGLELAATPTAEWRAAVMGQSWRLCPIRIALIGLPAFAASLWALRRMAPTRPRLAGAAAGLLAGGLGASVYGLHCQETTAAFTAVWYTLGMLVWAAVGAWLGGRLLRW
jgi:hypothetical protein